MAKKNPFVSVIIPVYNDEIGIKNTLDSVLTQDYPREMFEIIAVDNNSSDNTKQMIECFDGVKYLFEDKIQSSYAARNTGVKQSKGGIIAFIDSECVAKRDWISEGIKFFNDNNVVAVAGKVLFTFRNAEPNIFEYLDSSRKMNQEKYVERGFMATANVFVRKKLFDKVGLFNENLISGGDYEFSRRIKDDAGKILYAEKSCVYHPARRNLKELIKKTIRVGKGQKALSQMKLLEHGNINLVSFFPIINVTKNEHYAKFNWLDRCRMIFFANVVKYRNLLERLK